MGKVPLVGEVAVFPLMRLGRLSRLQRKEVLASQPAPHEHSKYNYRTIKKN